MIFFNIYLYWNYSLIWNVYNLACYWKVCCKIVFTWCSWFSIVLLLHGDLGSWIKNHIKYPESWRLVPLLSVRIFWLFITYSFLFGRSFNTCVTSIISIMYVSWCTFIQFHPFFFKFCITHLFQYFQPDKNLYICHLKFEY